MKKQRFLQLIITVFCAVFFVCAGFIISNCFAREDTVTARAATEVTPTIYWGYFDNTKSLIVSNASTDTANATNSGSFSGDNETIFVASQIPWNSYRGNIEKIKILGNVAPKSIGSWFYGCSKVTDIDLGGLDTSLTTNMRYAFGNCPLLTTLDVSGLDTSNVTNMEYMFCDNPKLTFLDVSNFITSKVTTMNSMFYNCPLLTFVDVSKWDTSNVENMSSIFQSCSSLNNIDVSNWNTSNVKSFSCLFTGCSSLTAIDVSNWKTPSLQNMSVMFKDCSNLKSVDLSNFDCSGVSTVVNCFLNFSFDKIKLSDSLAKKIASDSSSIMGGLSLPVYAADGTEINSVSQLTKGGGYFSSPHTHDYKLSNSVDPTCVVDGSKTFTCSETYCGMTKTETIPSNGAHSFTSYTYNNDATCTADGTETAKCDNCAETDTRTKTGSMLPHVQGTHHDAVAATCSKTGNVEYWECANGCGSYLNSSNQALSSVTVPINPNGHSFTNYVSNNNATCTDNATETADCENGCGQTDTREILNTAKGHKWATAWSKDATNHWHVCENGCGVKGGETAHVYNWVTDTPATLTTSGIKHEECLCGAKRNENTEIPIQTCAHANLTHYDRVEATCVAAGNIEYWHCSDCNKNLDSVNTELPDITIPIDNTAHVYTNYVSDNNATCNADGTKTAQCDHGCGATDTVTDAGSMTQHSYEWVITKPATKDEAGLMQNKCSVCGDVSEEKEIAKLEDPNGGGEIDLPVDINVEFKVTQSSTDNEYSELEGLKRGYWAQLWYRNEDGTLGDEFTDTMNCFLTLKIPTEIIEAIRGGDEINRDKIADGLTVYYYVDGQRYDVDNFAIAQRDDESWQIKFNYNAKFRAEVVFNAPDYKEQSPAAGIPWWVWLLVGLGGAAVVGVVIVIIVVAKKKSAAAVVADNGEVLGRLDKQDEKLNEIREIVDGGFNDIVDDE